MAGTPSKLVIAGAGGDSGKTLVSLGLTSAWRASGLSLAVFKKGPDYIDAAWLTQAAGRPARNLDVWIMGREAVLGSFRREVEGADLGLVEGNRGVLDGYQGASTADLARLLDAPVLLVLDVTKTTRTAAAFVAGVRQLEPELRIAGVIANRVGGARHRNEVKRAIEEATGVPVLGALPRLAGEDLLPHRHLGLVPPEEHARMGDVVRRLGRVLADHVDLETLLDAAASIVPADGPPPDFVRDATEPEDPGPPVRIAVFRDSAFTFYYPDNLEALEAAGAELIFVSSFTDRKLPDADLVYLGGGFPETQAGELAANRSLLLDLRAAARDGMPIYAECGGLVYLAESVTCRGIRHELSGVLDIDVEVLDRPQGHGYAEVLVDRPNPFFDAGTELRGHEFHHSLITNGAPEENLVFAVTKGEGTRAGRDGIVRGNVLASWLHLHALGTPEWAPALVRRARHHAAHAGRGADTKRPRTTCGSTSK